MKTETRHITEVVARQRAITFVSLPDLQQYREYTDEHEEITWPPKQIDNGDVETSTVSALNVSLTPSLIETNQSDQERAKMAQALGLHENVSWAEIFVFQDEQARAALTKELGLPTYPVAKKYGFSEHPSWRNILTAVLGLNATASVADMIERIREKRTKDNQGGSGYSTR